MSILLAWLGNSDLRASESSIADDLGPILGAVKAMQFSAVHLLSDHGKQITEAYSRWLRKQIDSSVTSRLIKLTSPTTFEEIYRAADHVVQEIKVAEPSSGRPSISAPALLPWLLSGSCWPKPAIRQL
jgi:hypothetical protein